MRLAVGRRNAVGYSALQVYDLAGTLLWEALPNVGSPTTLYVRNLIGDSAGNIYVAGEAAPDVLDGTSYNVRRISPVGDIDWRLSISGSYSYSMAILGGSLYIKAGTTLYQISLADGTIQNTASPGVADGNVFVGFAYDLATTVIYAAGKVSSDFRYVQYYPDLTPFGDYTNADYLFYIDSARVGYQINSWRVEKIPNIDSGGPSWSNDHDAQLNCAEVDGSGNVYAGTNIDPNKKAIFKYDNDGVLQWSSGSGGDVLDIVVSDTGQVFSASLYITNALLATLTMGAWTLGAGWTDSGTRLEAAASTFTAISNDTAIEIGKYYAVKRTVKRLELLTGSSYTMSVGGVSVVAEVTVSDVTTTSVFGPTTTTDPLTIIAYNPAYPDYACRPTFLLSGFSIIEVESAINTVRSQNSDGSTAWALDDGDGAYSIALVEDPPTSVEQNPYFLRSVRPLAANGSHSLSFI